MAVRKIQHDFSREKKSFFHNLPFSFLREKQITKQKEGFASNENQWAKMNRQQ
jgi:hypothetical protein